MGNYDKKVITSGSAAHEALSQIVLNRRWLKDVEKFLTFRSTSDLEFFQNHMVMYAGKRFLFSPPVGPFLLHWTTIITTNVQYMSTIKARQKRVYSKKSKRYCVRTVKEAKDYRYIPRLQSNILGIRLKSHGGLPRRRSVCQDDPRTLGLLPGVVPPPSAELALTQLRRGQDMTSTT